MDDSHSGGGIYFGGEGALTLNVAGCSQNQAGYGGGIDVSPTGPTTLTLLGSVVSGNTALVSGGGIRIEGPTTLIASIRRPVRQLRLRQQQPALGQGNASVSAAASRCSDPRSRISLGVALNVAPYGGGIAAIATDQGEAVVNVYTTDGNSPVSIYGNHADQYGGGIYLDSLAGNQNRTTLCAADFALDQNTASTARRCSCGRTAIPHRMRSSIRRKAAACPPMPSRARRARRAMK